MKDLFAMILKTDNYLSGLGIEVKEVNPGSVELVIPLKESLLRIGGIMNGGAIMSILDAAGGLSVLSYGEKSNQVTISLNTSFYLPVKEGPVTVRARVTKKGRNVSFSRIELFDAAEKLCAEANGSWYLFR